MNNSSYTGRAPRNMQSAFNPHCDNRLHGMRDTRPVRRADWALYITALVAVSVIVFLLIKEAT